MSNYYQKQYSRVVLSKLLKEAGFTLYGYKEDESDCMTDYWSPADWHGIATKGKYIAVVDNKGKSGFEILMNADEYQNYINKVNGLSIKDRQKIESLERLAQDRAASVSEKENALSKIENIRNKNSDICEVVAKYKKLNFPATNYMIFIYDTEQNCIVYKDTGLTKYDFNTFQFKIEEGKIVSRTLRDYDTNEQKNDLSDEEIRLLQDTLDTFKNLDSIKDGYYQQDSSTEFQFDYVEKQEKTIDKDTFIKSWNGDFMRYYETRQLGFTQYIFKRIKTDNSFMTEKKYASISEREKDSKIFYTQIQVPKKVWVKGKRGIALTAPKVQTIEGNYTIKENNELKGYEVVFTKKPSQNIIDSLKTAGFRWSSFGGFWYIKQSRISKEKIIEILK